MTYEGLAGRAGTRASLAGRMRLDPPAIRSLDELEARLSLPKPKRGRK